MANLLDSEGMMMTTQSLKGQPLTLSSTEEDLTKHSADLLIFSRYLERVSARVRIDVKDSEHRADVYAVYRSEAGEFRYKFARFIPDDAGFSVKSDEIYTGIHDAFKNALLASSYIGFRGCGRFPIAPLMQVAKLYERYGRGIFLEGNSRPSPCAAIELQYGGRITSFRTDAPLK